MTAIFGLKPCCAAWAQKFEKVGNGKTPCTISAFAFLNTAICAEKSVVSNSNLPGSMTL